MENYETREFVDVWSDAEFGFLIFSVVIYALFFLLVAAAFAFYIRQVLSPQISNLNWPFILLDPPNEQ